MLDRACAGIGVVTDFSARAALDVPGPRLALKVRVLINHLVGEHF